MSQPHGHRTARDGKPSPTYVSWTMMIARCYRPSSPSFKDYGARGIAVCERWRKSFTDFLADMGERPEGKTLDRIQTSGGYEPGNCRWATRTEQNRNKRNVRRYSHNGLTLTLAEWGEKIGVKPHTLEQRIYTYRWPLAKALKEFHQC